MKSPSTETELKGEEEQGKTEVKEFSTIEELDGSLKIDNMDQKLMRSVMENDSETIEEGNIIQQSINRGMGAFTPDLMFERMVKNYTMTRSLMGDALIRAVSGYNPDYVEKNIGIPEFQRELKKKIEEKAEKMKGKGLIDKQGLLTERGIELASVVLYMQELDNIIPKGMQGERVHKRSSVYGDKLEVRNYRKGDRYRDIALKMSAKTAIRRGHDSIDAGDLKTYERGSKGEVYIIYGLDSSGSMKGDKIGMCKKAGVALAYKAIKRKDKVGLVVFGTEVERLVEPTDDFSRLLNAITRVKAAAETDISVSIHRAVEMFPAMNVTKHLLLLTDALPTKGDEPEKKTLEAVAVARAAGITISVIGINLDDKGRKLAEKMIELGDGKLYAVRDLGELDKIVLEDYYRVM
ncbi:TPA: VWA domain-containing protein [Candidatus Woesearchaeota archaeon]|nr:VWA domain-containing protein [Candidatus Woesearchaeota archaeon]